MLAIFSTQAGAVLLHHVETEDVPGTDANNDFVLVSPDGKHVYTNSSGLLRIFSRDADTGALATEIATITADDILAGTRFFPRMAAFGPGGEDLYVLASFGFVGQAPNDFADSIMHFKRDTNTGLLAYERRLARGIDFTEPFSAHTALVVTEDGFFIYAAGAGNIFVFKRDSNGALSLVEIVNKDSNGEALGSLDKHHPALSGDGKNLYVTSLDGKLFVFSRDEVTGKLTALQTFRHDELTNTGGEPVKGLERSEGIVVTSDGRFVYVSGKEKISASPDDSLILTFSRDPNDGKLTFVESLKAGVFDGANNSMLWPQKLILGPEADEKFLYVATLHGVNVFRRNQDGSLQWLERVKYSLTDQMAISPDGKNLYVDRNKSISVLDISTDLSVVKTDSTDPVAPSGNFSYTLAVTNNGPADALNVVVADTLPAGVSYVSGSVNAPGATCSENGGTVTCSMGDIANTGAVNATIEVTAPATEGTITNTASIKGDQADPKTANSTDSEDTSVAAGGGTGGGSGGGTGGGSGSGSSSGGGGGGGSFGPGFLLLFGLSYLYRRKRGS